MPLCAFCDRFCLTGQVCGLCARRVPYEKLKSLLSAKLPSAKAVILETTYQPAKGVSKKSESVLASNIPGWVPKMIAYLNGMAYWNAGAATTFGDQTTPTGCTEGTNSLDFQGIRAGKSGLFWIDIQAQSGKDNARDTYAQVMIQTQLGVDIPALTIITALLNSLKQTAGTKTNLIGVRAVIHDKADADKLP